MNLTFPITIADTNLYGCPIGAAPTRQKRDAERMAVLRVVEMAFEAPLLVAHHADGSPYLPDKSVNISISHGAGWAVLAVNPHSRVGVDVECWSEKLQRVLSRVLNDNERQTYTSDDKSMLIAWTSKEAVFKALGIEGLTISDIILPAIISDGVFEVEIKGYGKKKMRLNHIDQFPIIITVAELL